VLHVEVNKLGHTGITWPFTPEGARQAMQDIGSLGYAGIELFGFVLDAYPGGIEAVRADLRENGLQLTAAYCSAGLIDPATRTEDIEKMAGWAEKVRALGGAVIVVGANASTQRAYSREDYGQLCQTLNAIGERCTALGVQPCFHPHTGTPVETREQIDLVMSTIDPRLVFMAPDTGQIAKGGGDPVEVVRTYRDLVRHMHLKDYVGGTSTVDGTGHLVDRTGYLDYVPLGEGVVNLPAIARILEERGYDGWWMVELDGTPQAPQTPREAAARSRRYLDVLARAHG
jgi:inosose dehydratase